MRLTFFWSCSVISAAALSYLWLGQSKANAECLLAPVMVGSLDKTIVAKGKLESKQRVEVRARIRTERNQAMFTQKAVSDDALSNANAKVLQSRIHTSVAQFKADPAALQRRHYQIGDGA